MGKSFGWCFIGCGRLAGTVARQITASRRHRIVSVYGRSRDRREEFTEKHGGVPYSSARAAITAPGVEGVYIVTPHASHYEYAKLALELGKPVLCEKAFTVTAAQARELMDLAAERRLYIAEAMWTWFAPVPNAVKRWVDAGEFGKIKEVKLCCHSLSERYAPRVTDPWAAGGGLLDMGVYAVTYLYRLFGKPTKIECAGRVAQGIDWSEEIALTFPSGERYTASVSISDREGMLELAITGARACLNVRPFHAAGKAVLKRLNGSDEIVRGDCDYLNEFDIVAAEIRAGLLESRYVPHRSTLDVMEILDECRRQLGLVYPFERAPGRELDMDRLSVLTFPLEADRKLTPEEALSTAARAGLTHVDLMDTDPDKVPEYLTAMDRNAVECACYIAHISFFQNEGRISKALKEASDTARRLGSKLLMVVPFAGGGDLRRAKRLGREAVRERLTAGFRLAVEWAYACGLTACFENTPQEALCLSGIEDCRYILDRVHGLGLVFDTANVLSQGDDPLTVLEALRDRIVHVHLKDVELLDKAPDRYRERAAGGKFTHRVLFGDGVVPVRDIYDRLNASGYEGRFAIGYALPLGPDQGLPGHRAQMERFVEYLK